ncbi:MAG: redoxin family protein, partial [Bacteroidales bacterium]|nr:redoxin family protein [Bacteroidales bacterium]
AGIQNEKVAKDVVREYRNFVKATEAAAADEGNGWTEEQTALWDRVVSPYRGNMLFLDFWGMGCGPCRSGMIAQKKRVEELKDEKIKFLYIATEDEKPSAEKWMDENGIRGEHVYITRNEWKQFEAMINFTAIPRGVLVGKDGKIIESDFSVGHYSTRELKAFIDRF